MTLFDIVVPLTALAIAGVGILIFHFTDPDRKRPKNR
jgi:hypothetical protein